MNLQLEGKISDAKVKAAKDNGYGYGGREPKTTIALSLEIEIPKPRNAMTRDEFKRQWSVRQLLDQFEQMAKPAKKRKGEHEYSADPNDVTENPDPPCVHCGKTFEDGVHTDLLEDEENIYDDEDYDDDSGRPSLEGRRVTEADVKTYKKDAGAYLNALYEEHQQDIRAYNQAGAVGAQTLGILMQLINTPIQFTLTPRQASLFMLDSGEEDA